MNLDRMVVGFAGFVVLASLLLGHYHSPYWHWLTAFVGLNLLQSSLTGFCPLAVILKRFNVPSGIAYK